VRFEAVLQLEHVVLGSAAGETVAEILVLQGAVEIGYQWLAVSLGDNPLDDPDLMD
jgi:hypothetical protein